MTDMSDKMDELNALIEDENSRIPEKELHEDKIALQTALLNLLNETAASEAGVSDCVKSIKQPNAKNLAEKKKRLMKSKNDMNSVQNSKAALSTKWRKFGDLSHKMHDSVEDIKEVANNSTDLADDLNCLATCLQDLLNSIKDIKDRVLSEFFELCELPKEFVEKVQAEAEKGTDHSRRSDRHHGVLNESHHKSDDDGHKMDDLQENVLQIDRSIIDKEGDGTVPELSFEERYEVMSTMSDYNEPL